MMEKIAPVRGSMGEGNSRSPEQQRLKDACCDFEAILLSQVFKAMRANPLAVESPDPAREVYEEMMDQSLASHISRKSHTGLAAVLYEQLSPLLREEAQAMEREPKGR